jgi:hypothetical protein
MKFVYLWRRKEWPYENTKNIDRRMECLRTSPQTCDRQVRGGGFHFRTYCYVFMRLLQNALLHQSLSFVLANLGTLISYDI